MKSALHEVDLTGTRLFLRADLNTLIIDGKLISEHRLEALRPTLNLLCEEKARIVLATHIGRPEGRESHLSTKKLVPWFEKNGYRVIWSPTLEDAQKKSHDLTPGTILLLENLRFHAEERTPGTPQAEEYAQQLKSLADYYVNDAWAVLHKTDVSLTVVPTLFAKDKRTIGLLIENELRHLTPLREPKRPYTMILGGAKLTKKIPLIEKALDVADTVIVLPSLAFTLLKAEGISVGESLVDDTLLPTAQRILEKAHAKNIPLILPQDFLIGNKDLSDLSYAQNIPDDRIGIAIGLQSYEIIDQIIRSSETVFYNGAMGFFEAPETLEPLKKLLQTIARTSTYSVVGGGESVAAVCLFTLEEDISFCSTGGGSTVTYITRGTLPGLTYFSFE